MPDLDPDNAALRERTGNVNSDDPVTALFYRLLRDHLPAGVLEELVRDLEHAFDLGDEQQYCNGHLARYAEDLAERLMAPYAATLTRVLAGAVAPLISDLDCEIVLDDHQLLCRTHQLPAPCPHDLARSLVNGIDLDPIDD